MSERPKKAETQDDDAHLDQIADAMNQMALRQVRFEHKQKLNSFVAYILFTVLLGGAFFLLYRAQITSALRERDRAVEERDALRDRAASLQVEVARRDRAEKTAYDYYLLARDKQLPELITGYRELSQQDLTRSEREFFAASVQQAREELVAAAHSAGLEAFRLGQYQRATTEFERARSYAGEGERAAFIHYYLGRSLHSLGRHADAVRELERALADGVEKAGVDQARFYLAEAFQRLGTLEEAQRAYERFSRTHPRAPLALTARQRAASLARQIRWKAKPDNPPPVTRPVAKPKAHLTPPLAAPPKAHVTPSSPAPSKPQPTPAGTPKSGN